MKLDDVVAGDHCRYWLADERDPLDRRIWLTRWTWCEVVSISKYSGRVTIRLTQYPGLRARSVKPWRLMA